MVESPVTFAVGDVTITRVLEKELLDFTPKFLFPECDPAAVQENQEWMAPGCGITRTNT